MTAGNAEARPADLTFGTGAGQERAAEAVSVIVPAYNAGHYLDRTLASVRAQTHAALEILIIDDGSTDDTLAVAERHAAVDPRIRIVSTPNRGVCAARNLGIEAASSALVAFVDADDLWHPTKIEKQLAAMDRLRDDPHWVAVYTFSVVIDEDDRFVRFGGRIAARGDILASHLAMKFIGNGSSIMVRRDAALSIGGFDTAYAADGVGGCEDLDFELRLAARFRIEVVPEILVGYRVHSTGASSRLAWMLAGLHHVTEKCIRDNPTLSRRARRYARSHAASYAAQRHAAAGEVALLMGALCKLVCLDPALFVEVAPRILMRLKGDALRLRLRVGSTAQPGKVFHEISSTADTIPRQSIFLRRRIRCLFHEDCLSAVGKNGVDH